MIPQKFTYSLSDVAKAIAKHNNVRPSQVKFAKLYDGDFAKFKVCGIHHDYSTTDIGKMFGADGGYYDHEGFHECKVKWADDGQDIHIEVWKSILTEDEFWEVMRRHNVGFADKGNPNVLKAVIVYNPSASNWYRYLWNCDLKDRAYYCWSNAEVFLEKDPSAGMCRHAHCVMESLRGGSMHGGETLLRMDYSWKVDYCYIEEENAK